MSTFSGVDMGGAFLSSTSSVALIECAISVSTACNVDRVYPFSTSSTVDVQGVYCISLSTGCCMDVQGVSNLHHQQCGRAGCIQPTSSIVWTTTGRARCIQFQPSPSAKRRHTRRIHFRRKQRDRLHRQQYRRAGCVLFHLLNNFLKCRTVRHLVSSVPQSIKLPMPGAVGYRNKGTHSVRYRNTTVLD
jgi:hypothetical protein